MRKGRAMPALPARPSREHLRKAAKRLARERSLPLADAQRALANDYEFPTWAALMQYVANARGVADTPSLLLAAIRDGNIDAVRALLEKGANPNVGNGRESPLHLAARRGPLALVETLITWGALDWQTDGAGRTPLDVARCGRSGERPAIVALLERPIADPSFRAAVEALQAGDIATLARLLDAEPRLLRERIAGPDAYRKAPRHEYFRDPKLFWFVAFNPGGDRKMPANITEVARLMIERGATRADLDYALELTMSSSVAREARLQVPLIRTLLEAGASATRDAVIVAAGYREVEALRALIDAGRTLDALLAAALGDAEALRRELARANRADATAAFGLAVINRQHEALALALAAGADVNAALPVHVHCTALHQAASDDDAALIRHLLAHGARADARDTIWDATPLEWATYLGRPAAKNALEEAERNEARRAQ